MRIVHISDWHGESNSLPEADLYVVTGDMLPNFCTFQYEMVDRSPLSINPLKVINWPANMHLLGCAAAKKPKDSAYVGRITDPADEFSKQNRFIDIELQKGGFRRHLGSHDAQVVVIRGNHDFVDLGRWFGGDVFEFGADGTSFEFKGLKISGVRGINWIVGEWSDELTDPEWRDAMRLFPDDCDMLLTHAPPRNILDSSYGSHYGADILASYVHRRMIKSDEDGAKPLRAHFFGHIHEANGSENIEGILFSNAATTHIVHDI